MLNLIKNKNHLMKSFIDTNQALDFRKLNILYFVKVIIFISKSRFAR
jgi:hypothetical protein